MSEVTNTNDGGQGGQGGAEGHQGSLLNQGGGQNDWLPEKFRTVK